MFIIKNRFINSRKNPIKTIGFVANSTYLLIRKVSKSSQL
ncbi:hypothetical protein ADIWIN_1450 [Winogradskyella psychrotolerans RS-3]|uniref:Uncharacterized protein n=1 Tax=Winogradskyella psychrotolerans RS-3 TaxID=641526 RepID=S7VT42_9FLAO|nr:hypothetical protein ADIWIN_1450 [Winogradskyella psychrotolerans RS-3]